MLDKSLDQSVSVPGRETLTKYSFPPHLLARLQGAFDDVWEEVSPRINDANRDQVSAAIAEALVSLAGVGQHAASGFGYTR
jgi:hypothetical protein